MTTLQKKAAYARQWRAKNRERSREISRKAQAKRKAPTKPCGWSRVTLLHSLPVGSEHCARKTRHESGLCPFHRTPAPTKN